MKKILLLPVFILFVCAGCLNYSEEIWFNNDMSGTITMDILIDEKLVNLSEQAGRVDNIFSEEGIRNRFGNIGGIKLIESKILNDRGNRHATITLDFESIESLKNVSDAKKETGFLGEIEVIKTDSLITYSRTVVMSDDAENKMIDQYMGQFVWRYTVHFPNKVLQVNRSVSAFDTSNNTATWEYSLAELTKQPQRMIAVFVTPSPRDYIAMIVGGLVFLVFVIVLYRKLGKIL